MSLENNIVGETLPEPLKQNPVLRSTVTRNVNGRNAAGHWSQETKEDCVQKWLVLGNMKMVSALTGVDYPQLLSWRKTDWWAELVNDERTAEAVSTDATMSRIAQKALTTVEDRLEHGEMVLNNKTGELVRKPVSMRDASRVTTDLMQRQAALRKGSEETLIQKDTMQTTLVALAKEFSKWANKKDNTDATDIPFVEVSGKD